MAVGFGTIGYWFVRLMFRIRPPIALRFSTTLDKEMKKSSFSGRGVIFLKDIKKSPAIFRNQVFKTCNPT
jgi:hypothetical protein